MKRLLSLMIALVLCPQIALASQIENFRLLIDNYHYATTVEWDQKDSNFLASENEKFQTSFAQMRANGLTNQDIQQVIPADWDMLERELLRINLEDTSAIRDLALKSVIRTQGASWNGEVIAPIAIGGAFALLIGYFVVVAVKTNRAFEACVEANGGNEAACIDR